MNNLRTTFFITHSKYNFPYHYNELLILIELLEFLKEAFYRCEKLFTKSGFC